MTERERQRERGGPVNLSNTSVRTATPLLDPFASVGAALSVLATLTLIMKKMKTIFTTVHDFLYQSDRLYIYTQLANLCLTDNAQN